MYSRHCIRCDSDGHALTRALSACRLQAATNWPSGLEPCPACTAARMVQCSDGVDPPEACPGSAFGYAWAGQPLWNEPLARTAGATATHEDPRWPTQAAAQGPTDEAKQQLILDFLLKTNEMFPDTVNQPSFDTARAILEVARSCPCSIACLPQSSCHRRCALALAMQGNSWDPDSALDTFCEHRDEVI